MKTGMTRAEKLRELARVHDEWVGDHLEDAPFHPEGRPEGSDYNQHHVDVDAGGAAEDDFTQRTAHIFSVAPETS